MESVQGFMEGASASRPTGEWNDDDFDVLADGAVVRRIFKVHAAPVGSPWMWTFGFDPAQGRKPAHGCAEKREDAKTIGSGCSVRPPACSPLLPQGDAIGALRAYRGTAPLRPGPHRHAAGIVLPARGTILTARLAWRGISLCRESNSPAAKTFRKKQRSGSSSCPAFCHLAYRIH